MEELLRLLPDEYGAPIRDRLCYEKLTEVRIINGAPVRVCYGGEYMYLCAAGITGNVAESFRASWSEANEIVMRSCRRSLYTVAETIRRGYISVRGGIRIGVCGSGVVSDGALTAVKDFSSVNIRIPHEVKGCASSLYARLCERGLCNTLIVSPPGAGKTTLLRDLCRRISERGRPILLCDEKYEIAASADGAATLDVGKCTDVMSGIAKAHVFTAAIANMRPDVVLVDELYDGELEFVRRAAACGVKVVATVHAGGADELIKKPLWEQAITERLFGLYAFVSDAPARSVRVFEELK